MVAAVQIAQRRFDVLDLKLEENHEERRPEETDRLNELLLGADVGDEGGDLDGTPFDAFELRLQAIAAVDVFLND